MTREQIEYRLSYAAERELARIVAELEREGVVVSEDLAEFIDERWQRIRSEAEPLLADRMARSWG